MNDHTQGRIQHIERIVEHQLALLHQQASPAFNDILKQIPLRVEWDSKEHDRYGDFFGVPLDMGDGANSAPADIILYAAPLLAESHGNDEELHRMVKKTLMHEIGHYLGLDHTELAERGWA